MSVSRSGAIGGTLALGAAVALVLGTWLFLRPPDPQLGSEPETQPEPQREFRLGPHDGFDLPGVDTGRVAVGDVAPDFSLVSYAGPVTTLSDFRGDKNVVLQFYRGHW